MAHAIFFLIVVKFSTTLEISNIQFTLLEPWQFFSELHFDVEILYNLGHERSSLG